MSKSNCLEEYSFDEIKGYIRRRELGKICSKTERTKILNMLEEGPTKVTDELNKIKAKKAAMTLQKGAKKMENVKNFEPSWLKEAGAMMPTQQGIAPVYSQANEPAWLTHAGSLTLIDNIAERKQREAYKAVTSKIKKLDINGKSYYLIKDTNVIINKEAYQDKRLVELGKLITQPNGKLKALWLE
tara:strand:+ start:1707 stop:2264 length:558 start_codon:yes stop_codon:yes gene_type:complete